MPVNGHDPEEDGAQYPKPKDQRKKVVVVGLGMVGIAFMWVHKTSNHIGETPLTILVERNFSRWMQRGGNTM